MNRSRERISIVPVRFLCRASFAIWSITPIRSWCFQTTSSSFNPVLSLGMNLHGLFPSIPRDCLAVKTCRLSKTFPTSFSFIPRSASTSNLIFFIGIFRECRRVVEIEARADQPQTVKIFYSCDPKSNHIHKQFNAKK